MPLNKEKQDTTDWIMSFDEAIDPLVYIPIGEDKCYVGLRGGTDCTEIVNKIKSYIQSVRQKAKQETVEEALNIIRNISSIGHGGGNWRRVIAKIEEEVERISNH
jgi:gamma-glutamyl:cysteine ligase YbdK (ATP-grasp superfamily)